MMATVTLVARDAQAELATRNDLLLLKSELKTEISSLSWQIKGLYAMNAATIAGIIWLAHIVLQALGKPPK